MSPASPRPHHPRTTTTGTGGDPYDAVIADAAARAASTAAAGDGGEPEPLSRTLQAYGEIGALRIAADRHDEDLRPVVDLLAAVAGECMSTAFSLWAHRMVTEYVRASDLARREELLTDLVTGRRPGSIAMATALQERAGLGSIPTTALPDGRGGYHVSGRIAWASNIEDGTLVVLPARVLDAAADPDADTGGRAVLTVNVGDAGFTQRPVQDLLALGSTRSAMLTLQDVHVPAEAVIASDLQAAAAQRTPHFLLQAAFCLGLARRCLREAGDRLTGPNRVLAPAQDDLSSRLGALDEQLHRYAAAPSRVPDVQVTRLRLDAARLAHAAARHESALAGGRGFVTTSAANRRLREASFLPVQSPSEVQLLWELAQQGASA